MSKFRYLSLIPLLLGIFILNVSGQSKVLYFGNVSAGDLSNKPYKPDPGADAIIISEKGIASLQYQRGFFIQFEKDVKIRIVNSNGFDYANIEIPYSVDDALVSYTASTFNLRNGEIIETKIPKKSFIIENTTPSENTLKFNFPDVHEGSVIEYSYKINMKDRLYSLVPWNFQHIIPAISSTFTVVYPDAFVYKSLISGSSWDVRTDFGKSNTNFLGESITASINTWTAGNVPAFRVEPYILSNSEHLTRVTFELARVDFPNITYANISPTYENLTTKLLDRDDFGTPLNTNLKSVTGAVTSGESDELSKLKKIHEYVSSTLLWDGYYGVTASHSLRYVLNKEKGSSAEINMILIAMLRSAGLTADPVILSTRSNGSLNQNSAMLQQFDYLLAGVNAGGKFYLVDATDRLRPYNQLPFDCLNKAGRMISRTDSKFVDLKNDEKYYRSYNLNCTFDNSGNLTGEMVTRYSDISAYNIRKEIKLESEEGYLDDLKSASPNSEISEFRISNIENIDSMLVLSYNFKITDGAQNAGNEILINPYQLKTESINPFYSAERSFPIDFGCPERENFSMKFHIPEGYSIVEKPENVTISLGKDGGKFEFTCKESDNILEFEGNLNITRTLFDPSEYPEIQRFYLKVQKKQAEFIVLKKNVLIKSK